ncbi:hypothetical protein D3C76_167930 [compost metagenome]
MVSDSRYPAGIHAAAQTPAEPEKTEEDWPDDVDDPPEPDPTWKHPDDGKSLSDLDEERPLRP